MLVSVVPLSLSSAAGEATNALGRIGAASVPALVRALEEMIKPIEGEQALTGVARTVCHDGELAEALGYLVGIIGADGLFDIRAGRGRGIERELITGSYYPGAIVSKQMISDLAKARTTFENAAILITDLAIATPQELVPVIRAAVEAERAVLAYTDCLVLEGGRVPDAVFEALRAQGDRS